MPEVTDPTLLNQLNGGATRRGVTILPSPDKDRDNARADAAQGNDAVRTELAITGDARAAGKDQRDADKTTFDKERGLAGEFNQNPEVKAYRASLPVLSHALRAPKNGQGDLSVIYAYAKMMDPTSVVREGEMDMATASSPWAQAKVQELRGQLDGSGRLPPAVRDALDQEMIRKAHSARLAYDQERNRYMTDAQSYGLDPNRVVGPHYGENFRDEMQAYDKSRGIGRFAPGFGDAPGGNPPPDGTIAPTMRGGLPLGTKISFEGDGTNQDQWWDRNAWLASMGLDSDKETKIIAFWNANRGNQNLTADGVRAWYEQNGLPQPGEQELQTVMARTRKGDAVVSAFDDSAAKEARRKELQAQIDQQAQVTGQATDSGAYDPTAARSYLDRFTNAPLLGASDEVAGLAGGIYQTFAGGDPVKGYTDARDAESLRMGQMDNKQGIAGSALEFVGSLPAAAIGPAGEFGSVRQAVVSGAKSAAPVSAVMGFNEGRGVGDSLRGGIAGAGLGAVAGGATGGLAKWGLDKLAARGGAGPSVAAQRYADAQDFGLDAIAPGDVGGMGSRVVERGLDVQPGAAGVMNANREKLGEQLTTAVGDVADSFGRATSQRGIGEAAQKGAKGYVSESEKVAKRLYDAIPIASDSKAVTGATVGRLKALTNKITSNPKLAAMIEDKRLAGFLDALTTKAKKVPTGLLDEAGSPITRKVVEGGGISWNDLKELRSRIGEEIGAQMFGEKTLKSDLRSLYGALSQDMEATATAMGPDALKAFQKANTFYSQRAQRIEDVIAPLLGKDSDGTPEAAGALIQRISKGGRSSTDLKMLAQIRRTLRPDEWGQVQNGMIRMLGQPAKSEGRAFSPDTFVRNFADMDQGAKNILFGKSELRGNLDKFVGVLEGIAKNNGTRNTSNTAMGLSGLIGYGTGGVPGLIAQTAMSYGGAKLWTSPAFVRWMTGYSKMLAAATRSGTVNASAHAGQMAALSRLAGAHPEIAPDARGLMQQLQQAFQGGAAPSAAESRSADTNTTQQVPQ